MISRDTFLSDSFPLDANGGGMKDGTYLQTKYQRWNHQLSIDCSKENKEWRQQTILAILFQHSSRS